MSRLHRRLRVPVAGLLLVLLVAPAAVACCLEMQKAMSCCRHDERGAALSMPCCVVDAESAPASQAPTVLVARADGYGPLSNAIETPALIAHARFAASSESAAGPPADRLYIRLSAIRR